MAYENNVYEFPSGQRREDQEAEQPQFLPADVGAETLDAYMNFRQSQPEDAFNASTYEKVGALLQRLSPVFANEGEVGIYQKLQEVHDTLASGRAFERGDTVIEPTDDAAVSLAMQFIELAREDKEAFLQWKNTPVAVEARPVVIETTNEIATFPTDAIGQFEVAAEYLYLNPQKNPNIENVANILDTAYQLRPLFTNTTEKPTALLIRIIETLDARNTFSENGVTLTVDAIANLERLFQLSTFVDKNQADVRNWYEQWFYPTNEVGRMEVATEYLFLQTTDTATRSQFIKGLDVTTRLRPVFDSISGYTTSQALDRILQTLEGGNNFQRAGVLLTADDIPALQTAYDMSVFEENNQELLQDWYENNIQQSRVGTQPMTTEPVASATTNTTPPENLEQKQVEASDEISESSVTEFQAANNFSEYPEFVDSEEEATAEIRPTTDQAYDLERFVDYLAQTKGLEHPGMKDFFAQMRPIFENIGTMPLADLFERIQAQLEGGDIFDLFDVRITPEQSTLVANTLSLLALSQQEKDEFDNWKKAHPDATYDEDEEGVVTGVGEQLFAPATAIAAEQALTETWKTQTRYISDEMKKLQTEVTNRRLDGMPHIFPPDFESIVGQFIYRLNRVTELKPTMIAEFENEFTNLLEYFDLRMLRTAGEELDQELPDDPESLERVDASLDTIDEQLTNLMLLQTNEPLIKELRNIKYRLDLLRGKINRDIIAAENAERAQDQRLAA